MKAGKSTGTSHSALVPHPRCCSVTWCLAESCKNGDMVILWAQVAQEKTSLTLHAICSICSEMSLNAADADNEVCFWTTRQLNPSKSSNGKSRTVSAILTTMPLFPFFLTLVSHSCYHHCYPVPTGVQHGYMKLIMCFCALNKYFWLLDV